MKRMPKAVEANLSFKDAKKVVHTVQIDGTIVYVLSNMLTFVVAEGGLRRLFELSDVESVEQTVGMITNLLEDTFNQLGVKVPSKALKNLGDFL